MINSKLILKIYRLLPESIKNNDKVIAVVMPIAERELAEVKHDVIKANWQKAELEKRLSDVKKQYQ